MARRFKKMRSSTRRGFKRYTRSAKRPGSSANLMTLAVCAGVYGAVRPKIEQVITPYTQKIPVVGNYGDEIVLGAAGYFMAKGKIPGLNGKVARQAGQAIMIIEATRIGSGLAAGLSPVSSTGTDSSWSN